MDSAHMYGRIIDLKKNPAYIPEYVDLRNHFAEVLLTRPVTVDETKKWLYEEDVAAICVMDAGVVAGAAVLYFNKKGEIAIFVNVRNKGFGTILLTALEDSARTRSLRELWAWVLRDNTDAQRFFEKNCFLKKEYTDRVFRGIKKRGVTYIKSLHA